MLFTSDLKISHSAFLPIEAESNVGCFNVGLLSLGPMLVGSLLTPKLLLPVAVAMACAAALMASTTTCAVAWVIPVQSIAILSYFCVCFC